MQDRSYISRYCKTKIDLAFVIDTSRSIPHDDFTRQIRFIEDIVRFLDVGPDATRVASVAFSNHNFPEFGFNNFSRKQDVINAIKRIKHSRGDATRTYLALEYTHFNIYGRSNGERLDVPDVVIVLTDGKTNPGSYDTYGDESGKQQTQIEAAIIKARPAFIFVIGVGSLVDIDELNGMSSNPDEEFTIQVSSFEVLNTDTVKRTLLSRVCVAVGTTIPQPILTTPSNNIPDRPNRYRYCQTKVDLAFVVDTSRSIPHIDFTRQIRFIEDIVSFLDVGPDKTRVASVSFSNYNFPEFGFNNLSRKQDVMNAIKGIKHSQGDATRTYLALEYTHLNIYGPGNGERPDVADVVIVLTDGKTNPGSYDTYGDESGKQQTQIEAAIMKARPAFIFVIGVGSLVDIDELNGISSNPDEEFTIQVSSFEALNTDTVKRTLLSRVCVAVGTTTPQPILTTSFIPPRPYCQTKVDLAFVVDTSRSIPHIDFTRQIRFIDDIVSFLDVGPDKTRVASVSFSNYGFPEFGFNNFSRKQDVLKSIERIDHSQGDATRTYLALEYTHLILYGPGNGERPDVADVVIILTDGKTNPGSYDKYGDESGKQQTQIEAAIIKARPAFVFVIGVGNLVDIDELNGISSNPDEEFTIQVSSFEALNTDTVKRTLLSRVCYAVGTTTPQPQPYISTPIPPSPPCRRAVADIFFIADSSTSIGITAFNDLKRFAKSVVNRFTIGPDHIKIGLITFSDDAEIQFTLNTYRRKSDVINAVLNIPYITGITNTHKALQLLDNYGFTRASGGRGNTVPKIAIVVTDGASTKPLRTKMQAIKAKNQGIIMFAIGVGPYINQQELDIMASSPKSKYSFSVDSYAALSSIESSLARRICIAVGTTTPQPQPYISTPIPPSPPCRRAVADIFFIADSSTSIGITAFNDLKRFAKSVVNRFTIGPDHIKIGLITFSEDAEIQFTLNTYRRKSDVINAVLNIPYITGITNTHKALQLLDKYGFTRASGGRGNTVPKIAIVVTDGASTKPLRTKMQAIKAKNQGIIMFAIGVGPYIDQQELDIMASSPKSKYSFSVDSYAALSSIESSLARRTCIAALHRNP
ncbi:collagen alpha-4(VI) chain-like isoform X13 [Mytilus californianus]|uniref:collagen alpha-4(VI) chain-like isoform X13 n=1 Tax=Mytilus californianus TaxID=6549 RepID=UPI00224715A9|nr:collagen alpha-4(VI) chain-like isoform X13 [Mytilus californianus]